MNENQDRIDHLLDKLSELMKKQDAFQMEIEELRKEIYELRSQKPAPESEGTLSEVQKKQLYEMQNKAGQFFIRPEIHIPKVKSPFRIKSDLEKFIGESLISKIGIIITVIGVGIGAKYSIDHQLISPLTRVILGYILGLGLLGFAFYLRKQYENFSAVLLSGSMAIFYFITFAAYSFFELIPIPVAFSMMVLFTVFTVAAAISYNRQIIAHIGMVGAYAVPFLLSEGSGKVAVLFSYMAIINAGILVIAFKKYWKPLYYFSFLITWLVFLSWFLSDYEPATHFGLSWIFISIFFVTFYVLFLAYKLLRKEKFAIDDIILLLANSALFYGVGYSLLNQHLNGEDFPGLFTIGNSLLHAIAGLMVTRHKDADKNLIYMIAGLVITFITIAIPVQLDGNWIPLLWSIEAAILFWIGRTKNSYTYEVLSYALMIIAFFSLAINWQNVYHSGTSASDNETFILFLNVNFLTSMICVSAFSFMNLIHHKVQFISSVNARTELLKVMKVIMAVILVVSLYLAFYLELNKFWEILYNASGIYAEGSADNDILQYNENFLHYKTLTLYMYSFLFISIIIWFNMLKFKNQVAGKIILLFSAGTVLLFLAGGLIALGRLRETYLHPPFPGSFNFGVFDIGIRYISFIFVALMLFSMFKYVSRNLHQTRFNLTYDLFLHFTLLTLVSNELINWMDIFSSGQSYKLGLSILFGVYALALIVLGIWKRKFHLRIGAIVLFSLTLIKLFFYDLTDLDTISKTIVFVVLGLLLLVISFLYNKFRKLIFEEDRE